MKYKYSVVFLTVCVALLFLLLRQKLPLDSNMPPFPAKADVTGTQLGGDPSEYVRYEDSKYKFAVSIPGGSFISEYYELPGVHYEITIQNYAQADKDNGLSPDHYALIIRVTGLDDEYKNLEFNEENCLLGKEIQNPKVVELGTGVKGCKGKLYEWGGLGYKEAYNVSTVANGMNYHISVGQDGESPIPDKILDSFEFLPE